MNNDNEIMLFPTRVGIITITIVTISITLPTTKTTYLPYPTHFKKKKLPGI